MPILAVLRIQLVPVPVSKLAAIPSPEHDKEELITSVR